MSGIMTEKTDPISEIRTRFEERKKEWKRIDWKDVWWVKDLEFLLSFIATNDREFKKIVYNGNHLAKENESFRELIAYWKDTAFSQSSEIEHLRKEVSRLAGLVCSAEKVETGSSPIKAIDGEQSL